jgi:hypothetical protein
MLALDVLTKMGLVNCQLFNFIEHDIYINPRISCGCQKSDDINYFKKIFNIQ